MIASPITIEPLAIPASLDDDGAADFIALNDLRSLLGLEVLGAAASNNTPLEMLEFMQDQEHERKEVYVARQDDRIVGFAFLVWSVEPDTRITWLEASVHPEWRNQGLGTALFDFSEDLARRSGRPIVQGGGFHPPAAGPVLASPTGSGSIPRDEPTARFLQKRGYSLEQVYRYSKLPLPVDPKSLEDHLAQAMAKAGPDYRVHTWTHRTPEQWLDDIATIYTRMATDAPAGNLEIEEEVWDAERVRKNDERRLRTGRTLLVAAVEHIPGGRLVAFNGLSVPEDRSRPVAQGITLVLKEHRGHRLGMVTKIANIQQLQAFSPASPCIVTDNAEENRPMLDVNEAVGFVPIAYEGVWKKTFDDAGGAAGATA
jgi:GNAT superfamily N-acetyltransferase